MRTLKFLALALVGASVVIVLSLPLWAKAQREKQREKCLQHLCEINEPLNCCIPMECKLKPGDPINQKVMHVTDYFRGGVIPRCPSGVDYMIPFVAGGRPVCPMHGDLLAGATNIKVFGSKPIYPAGFRHK